MICNCLPCFFVTDIRLIPVRKIVNFITESCFQASYFYHKWLMGSTHRFSVRWQGFHTIEAKPIDYNRGAKSSEHWNEIYYVYVTLLKLCPYNKHFQLNTVNIIGWSKLNKVNQNRKPFIQRWSLKFIKVNQSFCLSIDKSW